LKKNFRRSKTKSWYIYRTKNIFNPQKYIQIYIWLFYFNFFWSVWSGFRVDPTHIYTPAKCCAKMLFAIYSETSFLRFLLQIYLSIVLVHFWQYRIVFLQIPSYRKICRKLRTLSLSSFWSILTPISRYPSEFLNILFRIID